MKAETSVPNTGEPTASSRVHANTSEETWKTSRCLFAKKAINQRGESRRETWHRTEQEGSGNDRLKACFHGWLGSRTDPPKNKKNTRPHHNGSANIPGSPQRQKTTQNTSRGEGDAKGLTSRSGFYLVGQWANRTGWPDRYNWTLGTYIHQSPLLWRWWAWALPRPSCLCPNARGHRNEGQNTHMGTCYNLTYSLGEQKRKEHHPLHGIRHTRISPARIKCLCIFSFFPKEISCIKTFMFPKMQGSNTWKKEVYTGKVKTKPTFNTRT